MDGMENGAEGKEGDESTPVALPSLLDFRHLGRRNAGVVADHRLTAAAHRFRVAPSGKSTSAQSLVSSRWSNAHLVTDINPLINPLITVFFITNIRLPLSLLLSLRF